MQLVNLAVCIWCEVQDEDRQNNLVAVYSVVMYYI